MATTTKKKTSAKSAAEADAAPAAEPEKIIPKEIDIHQYIPVRNGFHGVLVYKSRRSGEEFTWNEFGDVQEMELAELRNAKSASKGFFINNWFMFDDEYAWVIDWLGLGMYYRNAVGVAQFDSIFGMTPAAIKKTVGEMSDGQKASLVYRASELIASGEIDSRKVIAALEDALGIDLIEK
jgi:hypothetical protein